MSYQLCEFLIIIGLYIYVYITYTYEQFIFLIMIFFFRLKWAATGPAPTALTTTGVGQSGRADREVGRVTVGAATTATAVAATQQAAIQTRRGGDAKRLTDWRSESANGKRISGGRRRRPPSGLKTRSTSEWRRSLNVVGTKLKPR